MAPVPALAPHATWVTPLQEKPLPPPAPGAGLKTCTYDVRAKVMWKKEEKGWV